MKMRTAVIQIFGIVQGVGFRPFVSRAAGKTGVCGSVANKGSYVEIHAQGTEEALSSLLQIIQNEAPPRSVILKVNTRYEEEKPYREFAIIESKKERGDIFVSPDIATCEECRKELYNPNDRRYLHPFINCTACGPRLTILQEMPYDRERTSMREFAMCPECEYEYTRPESRRYDAQPVCCNDCGPELYLINHPERHGEAITFVRKSLMAGKIAAIKGIGGFHLSCDAHNAAAIRLLRERKHRPQKPFALMMKDLSSVKKYCLVSPEQEKELTGHQKPVILLERRTDADLPDELAPGNPTLGVMLPYAPVQMLLFDYPDGAAMTDVLVMTSGNVSGAPICRNDEDAQKEIGPFCDVILSHNRNIRLRADDSVMQYFRHKPYMIRRSRGYAPLPFMVSGNWSGQVLGIGGELKNTFALGKNDLFYPSSYIGDMADLRTVQALEESVAAMEKLLEIRPSIAACDLHPKYNTAAFAETLQLPLLKIQHHYAHVLSCMAENNCRERVIGVSFDGTGFGSDGTIWGGEILLADFDSFTRIGSIRPFLQIGGDASAREGWRIAVSMIGGLYPDRAEDIASALGLCTPAEMKIQRVLAQKRINCITSTSAGRLFDAVSAVCGIRRSSTFEGESAMALQFAAACSKRLRFETDFPLLEERENFFYLNTGRLFQKVVESRLGGMEAEDAAAMFQSILAQMTAAVCRKVRDRCRCNRCAFSGGVFQNTDFLEAVLRETEKDSFENLLHSQIPPNDGGIALGQAVYAMNYVNKNLK